MRTVEFTSCVVASLPLARVHTIIQAFREFENNTIDIEFLESFMRSALASDELFLKFQRVLLETRCFDSTRSSSPTVSYRSSNASPTPCGDPPIQDTTGNEGGISLLLRVAMQ